MLLHDHCMLNESTFLYWDVGLYRREVVDRILVPIWAPSQDVRGAHLGACLASEGTQMGASTSQSGCPYLVFEAYFSNHFFNPVEFNNISLFAQCCGLLWSCCSQWSCDSWIIPCSLSWLLDRWYLYNLRKKAFDIGITWFMSIDVLHKKTTSIHEQLPWLMTKESILFQNLDYFANLKCGMFYYRCIVIITR